MKFLVDAQLPRRLVTDLQRLGYEAAHTLDLPRGNRTTDSEISEISLAEERIVITKDADFVDSYLLQGRPYKLLLIATGNIRNAELLPHFEQHLPTLATLFAQASFVELNLSGLVVHA